MPWSHMPLKSFPDDVHSSESGCRDTVTARDVARAVKPPEGRGRQIRTPGSDQRERHQMKIAMFETEAWQDVICQCLTPLHDLRCLPTPLSEENANLFADVEAVSTFIDSKIDAATLKHMPKLRLIATRSTGHDHIDLASCHAAGVGRDPPTFRSPHQANSETHPAFMLHPVARRPTIRSDLPQNSETPPTVMLHLVAHSPSVQSPTPRPSETPAPKPPPAPPAAQGPFNPAQLDSAAVCA